MTTPREVGCFCFGCAVGIAAAFMLPPGSQRRAMKFLRQKANRGLGYAKDRVQNAHDAVDGAAARAGKVIDQVSEGLDSARRVISKVERLRNA